MKYLKYFNNHITREEYQSTNEDRTLVHYCDDANHLHYLNCSQKIEDTPIEEEDDTNIDSFNIMSLIDGIDETIHSEYLYNTNPENIEESIVENNLKFTKKYYKIKDDELVFDEEVFLEDYTVAQTFSFPSNDADYSSPVGINRFIIPSINGTFNENFSGYSINQTYYMDDSGLEEAIGSNKNNSDNGNTSSISINNNLAIRIYLYGNIFIPGGGGVIEGPAKLRSTSLKAAPSSTGYSIYLLPIKNYIINDTDNNTNIILQLYISIPPVESRTTYSRDNILCFGIKIYDSSAYSGDPEVSSPDENTSNKRKISDDEDTINGSNTFELIFPIQQFRTDSLSTSGSITPISDPIYNGGEF